ncbi:MAG: bifunctional methylenetetrahydrofolate dehydrogenase/methenyltetrahydrofolate cyclohydrolase FolD [Verrucomicrobiales bacterium]|jgi:methylenetetrahydrofolate dehydrogenase (NADP+)/methenyltetrahydrofolate cyclohydrolase|nr:bifunctional methylenetetrahydrofolate dehydrogenase/methenyltetrahydrofolate cyclohydrolase FolD [Verrucomicrobiales bacterium]MDP4790427.1 bifunctional methylenetetrahydrofolate dehydrogenase/methenyltetrahydrofolate cyclohydrolase FolD [Verrucomicrobiales bacterium]MDP4938206.1 bifunctional methylenetetrahydrofolate dehydrogenase/methenyltetrahydrofolate cyclohydrolase FolD [Verrucomicrobiales bacterium]MDP5006498.1 bifunctional methylenetetrahydrofolate dehydrogenase/methenyltetrahydrofol
MKLIEGAPIAEVVYRECETSFAELKAAGHLPGLAVVLVGDDPASKAYVGSKDRKCRELGLHSVKIEKPADISQGDLLAVIDELNADEAIHGILVQMPLPRHLDEEEVIRRIDPAKDVDGLHPVNLGKLAMDDPTGFAPCTPSGCQRMLLESGIETEGKHVVIVGRSLLVGKSLALLLMGKGKGANATVTVAHSRTKDLPSLTRQADILVAAIGIPHFIGPDHLKEGAVVIDVGINRIDDPASKSGSRLVGDVDFEAVKDKCEAITPVPGGVGRMTIAMLMANTIRACRLKVGL